MKEFLVQEQLLQSLFEYLMKRPMIEVENLVNGIRQVKPVENSELSVNSNDVTKS
jgi:hypothetical protein